MMKSRLGLPNPVNVSSSQEMPLWLTPFSKTSAIGLGIYDEQLRYQCINSVLADANGVPAEAHLGRGMREILGEMALSIEPVFDRVRASGVVVSEDISGRLPHRSGWICSSACHFPVKASRNRLLGVLVIDTTELNQVERFLANLAKRLAQKKENETLWLARELHGTTKQYANALRGALTGVTELIWRLDRNVDDQLAPMIASLDQRIGDMRKVVATVSARLPKEEGC